MAGRTITYTFVADVDNFERPLEGARRKAADFFSSIQKDASRLFSGRQLAGAFKDVGSTMTAAFTVPIVGAFGAVIKASSDFDREMVKSMAIMGPVSDALRRKMEDNARSVAKTFGVSHTEAARSYYSLASAGLTAEQSMSALPQVAMFAKAGLMEMGQATDLLVGSQTALGLSFKDPVKNAQELIHVSDVLVNANNGAIGSVQQFAEALSNKSGAAMRTYHQTVEQGTAVLMAYAQAGIQGATAGERYDILLRELTGAALKHAAAFKAAKIAVFDHTGALRPMADVIEDVEKRFKGMSDAQRVTELGLLGIKAKSQSAILGLLGMSGAIRENERTLFQQGSTALVAQKQMQSFAEQANLLKVAVVDVAISIGQSLLPIAQKFVGYAKAELVPAVESAVKWFKSLSPGAQEAVIGFTGLVAIAGPAAYTLGTVASSIGTVTRAFKVLMATNLASGLTSSTIALTGMTGGFTSFISVTAGIVAAGGLGWYIGKGMDSLIDKLRSVAPLLADMINPLDRVVKLMADAYYTKERLAGIQNNAYQSSMGGATKEWLARGSPKYSPTSPLKGLGASATSNAFKGSGWAWDGFSLPGAKGDKGALVGLGGVAAAAKKAGDAVGDAFDPGAAKAAKAISKLVDHALAGFSKVADAASKSLWNSVTNPNESAAPQVFAAADEAKNAAAYSKIMPSKLDNSVMLSKWQKQMNASNMTAIKGLDKDVLKRPTADLEKNLQSLSSIFNLATNKFAKTLASLTGSGAGLAGGITSLFGGGGKKPTDFGGGLTGILGKAGAWGQVASSVLSIGSSIFGLFKKKPKEPPPEPPKAADEASWKSHVADQLSTGTSGLAAGVTGIKITSAEGLTSQASIAGQQFWAVFKTQGLVAAAASAKEVLAKISESIGEYGSEAATAILDPIKQQVALAENESYAGAATGAKGFADVLSSQINARMPMSLSQLDAYGVQAKAAFDQAKQAAIDQGMSIQDATAAAYGATGGLIQTVIDASNTYGVTLDENTQGLVDQAKENNIAFSTSSTDRLIMSVDALTTALGGVPPVLAAITNGVNGIPTSRQINVEVNTTGGIRPAGKNDLEGPPDPDNSFASGTGGLRDFGSGELAMLHGREAVLTESQYARMNDQASGGALGGISLNFAPTFNVPLDMTAVRANKEALLEEFKQSLIEAVQLGNSPLIYELEKLGFSRA